MSDKIISIGEIRSIREFPVEIEYIVEDLLIAGTINMFTGESGSGKSTVITAMCYAIDQDKPFVGLETKRHPILILDRENSLVGMADRFNRVHVEDSPTFKVWGGWELSEPPAPWDSVVIDWAKACNPKPIVVVDSYLAFHTGDENSASDTRAYMDHFRRMADMGITIILIHHTGKAGSSKEFRGSSDIKASIDAGYLVSNSPKGSELKNMAFSLFKNRITVMNGFTIRYNNGDLQLDRSAPETDTSKLKRLLVANPGISQQQFAALAKEQDISRARSRDYLATGAQKGYIEITHGPRNLTLHSWKPKRRDDGDLDLE